MESYEPVPYYESPRLPSRSLESIPRYFSLSAKHHSNPHERALRLAGIAAKLRKYSPATFLRRSRERTRDFRAFSAPAWRNGKNKAVRVCEHACREGETPGGIKGHWGDERGERRKSEGERRARRREPGRSRWGETTKVQFRGTTEENLSRDCIFSSLPVSPGFCNPLSSTRKSPRLPFLVQRYCKSIATGLI